MIYHRSEQYFCHRKLMRTSHPSAMEYRFFMRIIPFIGLSQSYHQLYVLLDDKVIQCRSSLILEIKSTKYLKENDVSFDMLHR